MPECGEVGGDVSPITLFGIHHLKGDRVGQRLVDVDEADEDRCLVIGAPESTSRSPSAIQPRKRRSARLSFEIATDYRPRCITVPGAEALVMRRRSGSAAASRSRGGGCLRIRGAGTRSRPHRTID